MILNMTDKVTGGGGGVTVTPLSVTVNGTYNAPTGTAYDPVTVNVSGGGAVEAKDVNFYDYDGTIVYSYTKADFLALNAMPSNPDHSGDTIPLTSQGWNWSLADAKTYVTAYGMLEIGQMYKPTDNKTHIVIEIPDDIPTEQLTYYVRYTQSVTRGVTVDWGDGNSETFTGTTASNRSHTYAAPGTYDITLNVTSGSVSFAGTSSNAIYGSTGTYSNRYRIKHVRIGKDVTNIGNYVFYQCYALASITIPSTVTTSGDYMFEYCYALTSITLPSGVTSLGSSAFQSCYALTSITLPSSATSLGTNTFQYCYALKSVTIPSSVTSLGSTTFQYCYALKSVTIPSTIATISNSAFDNCYALTAVTIPSGVTSINNNTWRSCYKIPSITIPSTVTSIGSYAFQNCYFAAYIRLFPTTVPTLAATNAFSNIPSNVPFVVPDSAVNAYKTASTWSSYASRIIGVSDWNPA